MKIRLSITFVLLLIFPLFGQIVLVNQAGYLPKQEKLVYFTEPADSFFVVEKGTGQIYFSDKIELYSLSDVSTGLTLYLGNFPISREKEFIKSKPIIQKNLILSKFPKMFLLMFIISR